MIKVRDLCIPESEDVIIEQNHFPDGTLLLKTDFADHEIFITWLYENDAELFTIICLAKKAKVKSLFLPYIPHGRQDRIKSSEDTFTLKYFTEVINFLGFKQVVVLDPHSNVSTALIDRVVVQSPKKYIKQIIEQNFMTEISLNNFVLFFPDEGSSKRYADMFKLPYAFGIKKRDWKTGQILGLDVINNGIDLKDKTVLIVDDICSRGGTFYHSAKKLKEFGAKEIYLYISHCENTILEGEVLSSGLIDRVFTTNSIFTKEHENITVMEV